jgi:hypothetical protein
LQQSNILEFELEQPQRNHTIMNCKKEEEGHRATLHTGPVPGNVKEEKEK